MYNVVELSLIVLPIRRKRIWRFDRRTPEKLAQAFQNK